MDTTHSVRYREHRPGPAVGDLVECYWTLRGVAARGSLPRRVLPDGCSDVLFDFGATTLVAGESRPLRYAVGTMTRPIRVAHRGKVDLLGIRFRPGGASVLTRVPAHRLVDRWVDLDLLWGPAGAELQERMAPMPGTEGRIALLDRTLVGWARSSPSRPDRITLRAAALLTGDASAGSSVAGVASALGVSRRHLERTFREHVGLSPAQLRRVTRLRRAGELIATTSLALGDVAVRAGYHDQPHMGRDFRALAGITPGNYRIEAAAP